MGDVRKALQLFTAAPIAPKTDETFQALQALHPAPQSPVPPPAAPPSLAPVFDVKVVREALATFSPCSAAGVFGYRPRLLQQCARAESFHFVPTLARAVNMFAAGEAPAFLQPFIAGGVSIALSKPSRGVRPLCCGDSIRRLVAKCFCHGGKDEISKSFAGQNYGVGCPGGVEVIAHSLRDTLRRHKDSDWGLLKIDFKNAFNLLERGTFVSAVSSRFPAMELWTRWCYESPPLLIYDHGRFFVSACGVQQGDPLGPLYFCCGLQSLVDKIAALNPVYQKWYMDDGGIVGPVDLLLKVWEILKTDGPALGLVLNPAKCEWSWLNASRSDPCPIDQVELVPTSKIQMLGVPLGSDEFVASFVAKELLPTSRSVAQKLMEFDDAQAAMYLLRLSYGIVRANHFMRTTPLPQWSAHAVAFDEIIRNATEAILKQPMSDDAYAQAAVSTRIGGLGVRKVVDHGPVAFQASWTFSQWQCKENWLPVGDVPEWYSNQKSASEALDRAALTRLIEKGSDRDKQRLRRLDCEHANAWVTALPSATDGRDTILPPKLFIAAVARLLGMPVYSKEFPCPLCQHTMDVWGDHALCCKKTQDSIARHNRLRNWVCKLAEVAMLNPAMEKLGLLGPTDESKRRPGDVSIPLWRYGRGLAIDVAVICPVAPSHVHEDVPCELYAARRKHARYDAAFRGSRFDFSAMVFETSGAVNVEGMNILRQIIRFASKRECVGNSSFAGRAWARVGCCIQFSVAQAILNRDYGDIDECVVSPACVL